MFKNSFILKLIVFILIFFLLDFSISRFLLSGLNKYYGIGEKSSIALVGHSHLMLGVDKEKIEKELAVGVSKYTREGVNVTDRKLMIQQLLESNQEMKTLIYGVDAWTFSTKGLSSNSYKLFYPFLSNQNIENYVYNNSSFSDFFSKKIIQTTRYDELLLNGALRGHLGKWTNLKFGNVDIEALKTNIKNGEYRKINNTDYNINVFKETLTILADNNIKVILLYVPTIDLLKEVQEKEYQNTLNLIKTISEDFDNVDFLNLQEPWSHEHNLFYDSIHLNPEGQAIITRELVNYLRLDN